MAGWRGHVRCHPKSRPKLAYDLSAANGSIGLRSSKTGMVGWGRCEAGLAPIAGSPLMHQLVRAGEPAGLATGHRREAGSGRAWGKQARSRARTRAGERWAGGERPGRAAGQGCAADGLARKLGQGCMAENRNFAEIAQGALIERPGRFCNRLQM